MPLRTLSLALSLLLLAGCATVADFQKMSPQQRATAVCERNKDIRALERQMKELHAGIDEAQQALGRGYRVHRQCREVEVLGDAVVRCQQHGTRTVCNETRPKSYKTECVETPVAIDARLEQNKVRDWSHSLGALQAQHQQQVRSCHAFILPMTPEQAYEHY